MGRPIRILFGTETGNAEGCADELREGIAALGVPVELDDMDDYDRDDLASEELVFIVTSTFGNGDPPYNAHEMMEFVKGPDAPSLAGVKFSVCGLGDRSYPNFAQCGRDFDARFEALGAERIVPRTDCDVDFEVPFDAWKQKILTWLRENHPEASDAPAPTAKAAKKKGGLWGKVSGWFGGKKDEAPAAQPAPPSPREETPWSREEPFTARLVASRRLNGEGSAKETMHYTLDLTGSGIRFQGGDSFGVLPENPPEEVAGILACTGLDPESPVTLKDGRTLALRGALSRFLCLQTIPVDLLRKVSAAGGPGREALDAGADATTAYLRERYVWDLLREHPDVALDAQTLAAGLRVLPPRLYSVASSPKLDADKVDFVVETLRYERLGRSCVGVASAWMADRLSAGDPIRLYLAPNDRFHLPDPDVDILMIGPGTGIAPFRAFLQERAITGGAGRNWLVFGHQHQASDFLYRDEVEAWINDGTLARGSFAWSRDQDHKVYVQDKLREEGAQVWAWLDAGAHIFVCGDAHGMAPGVDQALIDIARQHGGLDADSARSFIEGLATQDRYHRDVY